MKKYPKKITISISIIAIVVLCIFVLSKSEAVATYRYDRIMMKSMVGLNIDDNKMIRLYDRAARMQPNRYEAYLKKSIALLHTDRYQEALDVAEVAFEKSETDQARGNSLQVKASILKAMGDTTGAQPYFDQAKTLNPRLEDGDLYHIYD